MTNRADGGGVPKGDTVDATGPAGKPSAGRLNPIDRLVRADREDRSVTVVVGHGTCDDGVAVEALETDSGVVLSASVRGGQGEACTADLTYDAVTVRLDRPVGDRAVLDARTGRTVPHGEWGRPLPDGS